MHLLHDAMYVPMLIFSFILLIIAIVLYDFYGEFGSGLSNVFLLMKLLSSALLNVLMLANHRFWDIRTYNIFEIVDNIVPGIYMLLRSILYFETRESFKLTNIVFKHPMTLNLSYSL